MVALLFTCTDVCCTKRFLWVCLFLCSFHSNMNMLHQLGLLVIIHNCFPSHIMATRKTVFFFDIDIHHREVVEVVVQQTCKTQDLDTRDRSLLPEFCLWLGLGDRCTLVKVSQTVWIWLNTNKLNASYLLPQVTAKMYAIKPKPWSRTIKKKFDNALLVILLLYFQCNFATSQIQVINYQHSLIVLVKHAIWLALCSPETY